MSGAVTIADLAQAFALLESEGVEGYVDGGAGAGLTVGRNDEAWAAIEIRPHALASVGTRDISTTVLGQREQHPVMVAPVGFQGYVHREAEVGLARGAVAAGARYCHSVRPASPTSNTSRASAGGSSSTASTMRA